MPEERKLRVIEVKDGRLPPGMSGEDIAGPVVVMEDGELPPGQSEERLIEIGATVLAVKKGDPLPQFITETDVRRYLQRGITEDMLEQAGYVVVTEDVFERGRADVERMIMEKVEALSEEEILWHLAGVEREAEELEERLAALRQGKDYLEKLLGEKRSAEAGNAR